ncbi:hypothetical protein [Brevundimonas nasdae]|uniref:hypothetical protein n=1 Tax=Brevundimonas nasdae TaxID=172043 RepID=UPI003F68F137
MVAFVFNAHGYAYQQGVLSLQRAYQSANDALTTELDVAKEQAATYDHNVENGMPRIQQVDDDGYVIFDEADALNMNISAADAALGEMRKAFVLAIYHHWERGARLWTGLKHGKMTTIAGAVEALGYPIAPGLLGLNNLANLIKHANPEGGLKLQASWPSTLHLTNWAGVPGFDWQDAIYLHDSHVHEAIDIIGASGPTTRTLPPKTPDAT